jgi:hypothetical protein
MKKILYLLVIALLMSQCKYFEKNRLFSNDIDTLLVYQYRADSIRLADSLRNIEAMAREQRLELETQQAMKQATGREKPFHLITGAFKTPNFATKFKDNMSNKGFEAKIIKAPNGFDMVSVETFDDFYTGFARLKSFRIANPGMDVWLYHHKE